jgi:hypothetical protein
MKSKIASIDCRCFLILEVLCVFLWGDWIPTSVILKIILVQLKEFLNPRIERTPDASRGLGVVGILAKLLQVFDI